MTTETRPMPTKANAREIARQIVALQQQRQEAYEAGDQRLLKETEDRIDRLNSK